MGELYADLDLLDDMVKVLGLRGPMRPEALAREVGHSEEAVVEQLTQSYYFEPSTTEGNLGKYELSSTGRERFEKIS